MTVVQTVLLVLLVPITLLNFLFLTSGRKKNREGRMRYRMIMSELHGRAVDLLGKSDAMQLYPYMSDTEESCILCVDRKRDLIAVVTMDSLLKMKISEPRECEIVADIENDKILKSVACVVTYPPTGGSMTVHIGSRPHRLKGYLGRFLMKNARDFKSEIEDK